MSRKKMMSLMIITVGFLTFICSFSEAVVTDNQLKFESFKLNISCILVFGDSSVDPGNNDVLDTSVKSNFLPYGKDFINGKPTGRFCNGRLATDFIAEALGHSNVVRGFLDPAMTKNDMLHGVSFASAASGYDEFTSNLSNVLSLRKQIESLRHYKIHLRNLVGSKESENMVQNAVFILSMGTNDFLQNYYVEPFRSKQYNVEQYHNYLISCARRVVVVGVPPFGCMPLVRMFRDDIKCDVLLNAVASSFNSKIKKELKTMKALFTTSIYVDIYSIILNAIENPNRYGIEEPLKGCCGSGTFEYGSTCKEHLSGPDQICFLGCSSSY